MSYPEIKFEDVRKGDVLRHYSAGHSIQATADQQISPNSWDTADGYIITTVGDTRTFYLVSREPVPDTPEPVNIASVVVDADGDTAVRVPPRNEWSKDVWFIRDAGYFLVWSDLTQPVKILHEGWDGS